MSQHQFLERANARHWINCKWRGNVRLWSEISCNEYYRLGTLDFVQICDKFWRSYTYFYFIFIISNRHSRKTKIWRNFQSFIPLFKHTSRRIQFRNMAKISKLINIKSRTFVLSSTYFLLPHSFRESSLTTIISFRALHFMRSTAHSSFICGLLKNYCTKMKYQKHVIKHVHRH